MFKLILYGIVIGIGAMMPGVSGGALAFILGVYDKLLNAITSFFTCSKEKRKEYFIFLTQIGTGIIIGVLTFTRVVEYLYKNYQEPTSFLFIGLVLASLPSIFKENKKTFDKKAVFSLIAGMVFMLFFLQFKEPNSELTYVVNQNFSKGYYLKLIFCGLTIASSLIIPGLSGTVLMHLMGEYDNVVSYINSFNIRPLLFIGIGGLLGTVIFIKILNFLFKKHKDSTIYGMMGLITGSVIGMWPGFSKENLIINIVFFVVGILIMYLGEKMNERK